MRKKYLSALLFGALLFASAGTFTSCKDYDDDINNLQEQINTINTTLTELKSQIGTAGVSSVTFDEATGVLTVVDAEGTHAYNIATSAEAMVKAEIKDGKLYINDEEIGEVGGGDTVTVEDGQLLVNGEAVAEVGQKVLLVKNEANQTYTLTVGDESVVLPANADATTTPSVEISNAAGVGGVYNVNWGVAEKEITFGDTKIAAGKLLLGGMTQTTFVTVKPVTYDLSAQTLKLIDMDGNYASVKVTATTDEAEATTGSRTVSNNGIWRIALSMLDTVTEENIETAFTKEVNGVAQNLKYALTVNGTRVTGYDFVIDTQTKNESETNTALTKDDLTDKLAEIEAGESTLSLTDFGFNNEEAADVVLSSLTLSDVDAEAAGVTVDGMSVNIPASYTGEEITVKLAILDVTGATSERNATIKVKASAITTVDQVKQVEVAISANGKFTVDFGEVFSKLDANVVKNIAKYKLTVADKNFFALGKVAELSQAPADGYYTIISAGTSGISFLKSDKKTSADWNNNGARDIVYGEVTLPKTAGSSDKYLTGATDKANLYGTFDLNLSMLDGANNELKKIVVPVKVVAPAFADYYTKNTNALWVDGAVSKPFATEGNNTSDDKQMSLITVKDGLYLNTSNKALVTDGVISYYYSYTAANGRKADKIEAAKVISKIADNDPDIKAELKGEAQERNFKYPLLKEITTGTTPTYTGRYNLAVSKLTATAVAKVATVVLSDASFTEVPVTVSEDFTVNIASEFAGAKLAYYENGKEVEKAVVNGQTANEGNIQPYAKVVVGAKAKEGKEGSTLATDYTEVYGNTGLAVVLGDADPVAFQFYKDATAVGKSNIIADEDNAWQDTEAQSGNNVTYVVGVSSSSMGAVAAYTASSSVAIKIESTGEKPFAVGQGGTMNVQFVDKYGIQTEASIDYIKKDEIYPADAVKADFVPKN